MPDLADLPANRFPRHIAIIMDGNGRWAVKRGLERVKGHQAGARAVRDIVMQLSVAAFWLFLTIKVLEARKWA